MRTVHSTNKLLSAAETASLEQQIAALEERTGVQIIAAVVGKSDAYVELPWKAFALGASLAAFALVAGDALRPQWTTAGTALLHAFVMLFAGGALAIATVLFAPFARLFLHGTRRDLEVRKHAHSLLVRHALLAPQRRAALLILVSHFERRIEILPDRGLVERLPTADWQAVIARMTPHLREARSFRALQDGIAAAARVLETQAV